MRIMFKVEKKDILRSPYYRDYFFESINIFVKKENQKNYLLFQSAVHGQFLIHLGEALIESMHDGNVQFIKSIGSSYTYEILLDSDHIKIKTKQSHETLQEHIYSKDMFIGAIAKECKNYLETIKKINPRIVLEDQYQLIASCYHYFDKSTTLENNRHFL